MSSTSWSRREFVAALTAGAVLPQLVSAKESADPRELVMVVMDPLAIQLSCPCVKGYAQREYDRLAKHLEEKLQRPVSVTYSDSLTKALVEKTAGRADLVIGKWSVVKHDAKVGKLLLSPAAMLTGKDGKTTQTGLIVVPSSDPAKTPADLKGYRIIFGPEECDEKHGAALALLKKHGVGRPESLETSAACADGATLILEAGPTKRGAAVISSYAKPLLEGCGTVKKGDLRLVGETEPVPFVGAFINDELPAELKTQLAAELLDVQNEVELCLKLETRKGFVAIAKADETAKKN